MKKDSIITVIIKSLAEKYNLSEEMIEKILSSQFKFIKERVKVKDPKGTLLHSFGSITPGLKFNTIDEEDSSKN